MVEIRKTLEQYEKGEKKPSEILEECLRRIEKFDSEIHSFLELQPEQARSRALEMDSRIHEMDDYPLFGIPVAVKDLFNAEGWKTTAGSKILENYESPYTSTTVQKLLEAGAILVGKLNMDEFAMGSSNENTAFDKVKNPWNKECVPGDPSGGSAAALAAQFCLGTLGTDTGGSVRQPASLCGVVGMKPTYGRVSRFGVIAFASSLDQVGPMGGTVWDTARLLEVIAGHDPKDSTSSRSDVPSYTEELEEFDIKKCRIGIPRDWLKEGVDPQVETSFNAAIDSLEKLGAQIIDVELPHTKYGLSTYYIVASSEASSNLARYDGVHYGLRHNGDDLYSETRGQGFGAEVKLRIMLGTYALSSGYYDAYYLKANRLRKLIQVDFEKAFQSCDCIATPTSATTAWKFGEKSADPIQMYLSDIFTLPAPLAGIPGISVPCGQDSNKLPIGLQFMASHFEEQKLFNLAHAYEATRGNFPAADLGGGN